MFSMAQNPVQAKFTVSEFAPPVTVKVMALFEIDSFVNMRLRGIGCSSRTTSDEIRSGIDR
jgi:hypothetical protein